MAAAHNITAWILLLIGLYSVSAAIGELRRRGTWARMMWEVERSKALQFLIAMICFVLGAVILAINPYNGLDVESILVTILGGLLLLEGIAWFAFPDWILRFSRHFMGAKSSVWAWFAFLIGIALLIIGYVRMLAS